MTRRHHLLAATILAFGTGLSTLAAAAEVQQPGQAPSAKPRPRTATSTAAPGDASEQVIVTGTHVSNRKARQSASPISVITAATLRRSGELDLSSALTRTYPSINQNAIGTNESALTSSIRMRGLNPNQVLILVDGIRRHTSANINSDAGVDFGSSPVDLNMIPAGAIDHIEVLEDGAAAMYGSDAIAGVVNIITKKTDHGVNMSAQTGANAYNGDGWQSQVSADGGTTLGGNGFLHLGGQFYHSDHSVVDTEDHRLLQNGPAGAYTGDYYTGDLKLPLNSNRFTSTPEETRENLSIDFGKPLTEGIELYGLITYAHRHAETYENFRLPTTAPLQYPAGFDPIATIEENDYAATLGLRGDNFLGFNWDLSSTYGADEDNVGIKSDVNTGILASTCIPAAVDPTSLYASAEGCGTSPESFHLASYRAAQWTNNLNFKRGFDVAGILPMTLAFGAEHRLESYGIGAGDPASYQLGGSQAIIGIEPQSAGTWYRDVWAAYIDDDLHPLAHWDLDFAGRFEHYTDTGNTENGKVSTRYDFTRRIAARATISNGFRAPTLAEQHYSTAATGISTAGGLLPVASDAARSLGAAPLKPERSTSVSGGFVLEPIDGFHVEADVYQINIRDRLVQGGTTSGPAAVTALEEAGFSVPASIDPANVSAYYITNGASTRTQGLDLKADYSFMFRDYGRFALSAGLDLNRTRITHIGSDTAGNLLLNAQNIASVTTTYPRSKLILNAFWTRGAWDVNLRQTRYGETTNLLSYADYAVGNCPDGSSKQFSSSCFEQFKNTPRWLTDLEVGYRIGPHWHMAVGANDIFNVRPREVPADVNYIGGAPYDYSSAQIGIGGGYYYGRVNYTF